MLERYAVKVARTVLRGGSVSNVTPLPDQPTSGILCVLQTFFWLQVYTALTCASRKTHLHPPQVRCRDDVRKGAGKPSPHPPTCGYPLKGTVSQTVGQGCDTRWKCDFCE